MKPGDPFNPYKVFVGIFIPNAIVKYNELSPGAKLCYGRLSQYAGENGAAYPSHETLAAELGISSRQVRRYIDELTETKFLKVLHTQTSNRYLFLWHTVLDESLRVNISTWTEVSTSPGQKCPLEEDESVLQRESLSESYKESDTLTNLTKENKNQIVENVISHYTDLFTKANGISPVITKANRQTLAALTDKHSADLLLAAVTLHVTEPDRWTQERGSLLATLEHNLPIYIQKLNQRAAEEEEERKRLEYQRRREEEERRRDKQLARERAEYEALPEEEKQRQKEERQKMFEEVKQGINKG